MKRTSSEAPYLSWCLIVRNTSETLEDTLKSVRARTPEAEIVIVDTMSSDDGKTVEIARRYADVFEEYRGPNGTWTPEMYAFDDASAARNESFRLATGKWIGWIDSDDVLPGPEETERLLKLNNRWKPSPHQANNGAPGKDAPVGLEDFLRFVDEKVPSTQGLRCPYLYQRNPDGSAVVWQERERFVRNNGKWRWQRAAHEILTPQNPADYRHMHFLSHLLFVHEKKFTLEDKLYSLRRHFDILNAQYQKGQRNFYDLMYLENFAIHLCPERRKEFLDEVLRAANTPLDKARALVRQGLYSAEQGYFVDTIAALGGAVTAAPEFPDAWLAGAQVYEDAGQYLKAAEWYGRGVQCPAECSVSDIAPRDQAVRYRICAGLALVRAARQLTEAGRHKEAVECATQASEYAKAAAMDPAAGTDREEASHYFELFTNERDSLAQARLLHETWKFLVRNEETQKAVKILDVVPHTLVDHPLVVEIERWSRKVTRHLTEPAEYRKFYDAVGTDIVSTELHEEVLHRTHYLLEWVRKNKPDARILEVGSFDGVNAVPLLRYCPGVHYTAVDTKQDALDRLKERATKYGVEDRLTCVHGMDSDSLKGKLLEEDYDVVVFFEVIEHVPDPVESLRGLLRWMRPDGRLFVSTPWGAYDNGFPANFATRDPRGHVRAMLPADLIAALEEAGGAVEQLTGSHYDANVGDTIVSCTKRGWGPRDYRRKSSLAFVVPSALWDWNATHVEETGIGASEETIVYLAREFAQGRNVEVYGPLPKAGLVTMEEVRDSVRYRPNTQIRHLPDSCTAVVSRSPSMGRVVDEAAGREVDKVLWLQDAHYEDLNPQTAALYRKIVVVSEWHKAVMHRNHGVPLAKMTSIENFILPEHFAQKPARVPHRFIYSSSPDRGLITLLKMWPDILARFPDAQLHIFYGWEGCMKLGAVHPAWTERYRAIRDQYLVLRLQKGIHERGRVNHVTLAQEMMMSDAWAYPTGFSETHCCTAVKMRAAGCVPVTTPLAALPESAASHLTQFVVQPDLLDPQSSGVSVESHPEWEDYKMRFVEGLARACQATEEERAWMSQQAVATNALEVLRERWREVLWGK